ncbi:MAG: hypothetical protein LBG17_00835 [Bacteroidales bacterium]|nr:hypothetical protein [Bacteroidales bacterium]
MSITVHVRNGTALDKISMGGGSSTVSVGYRVNFSKTTTFISGEYLLFVKV